jgi:hypothetical protein
LAADQIGRRTQIPRVALLLVCGLIAGAMGLLPTTVDALTDNITFMALTLVALLLGGSLKLGTLKSHGVDILVISAAIFLLTFGLHHYRVTLLGGALFLGLMIGLPAAFLTSRIEQGEPLQIEVLAIGFLTAGLAV